MLMRRVPVGMQSKKLVLVVLVELNDDVPPPFGEVPIFADVVLIALIT